jgi:hypothetical protein
MVPNLRNTINKCYNKNNHATCYKTTGSALSL